MANTIRAIDGNDGPPWVEPAMRQREISVCEDDAKKQERVGLLDHLCDCRVARRAKVGTEEDIWRFLQQATSHKGGHDRKPELARQCRDAVFETVTSDLYVHDNRASFSGCQPFDHLVRALDEGIGISRTSWQDRHRG